MPGACLMMGLKGFFPSLEEKKFIRERKIAGIVLFKRNIQSFRQTFELCSEIKSLASPPLLIAMDREGGEVDRLSHLTESAPWPAPPDMALWPSESIFRAGRAMARQSRLLGIDINFAPIVDLPLKKSPLLSRRLFGQNKAEILRAAGAFARGLARGGLIPCLKHFPGHGGVSSDSHKSLPKDNRRLKDLRPQLEIFQELFKKYPCWIMTAHVEFPKIDQKPATFSAKLLKGQLRKRWGFKGIVVSDDIDMSALKRWSAGERLFFAIKGGCDLAIACQKPDSPRQIIKYFEKNPEKEKEIKKELSLSEKKLLKLRGKGQKTAKSFKAAQKEILEIQESVFPPRL